MNFAFPLESDLPGIPGKASDAARIAVPALLVNRPKCDFREMSANGKFIQSYIESKALL